MECDNCLCNLERCQAECCKLFLLKAMPHTVYRKGAVLMMTMKDKDMQLYYSLHNQRVIGDKIMFVLNNFKVVGNRIFVYETCKYLTKENTCMHHADGKQPNICRYPNKDSIGENVYITPNCVHKRD